MAANINFRIQITSFAAQTSSALGTEGVSNPAVAKAWPAGRPAKSRPPTAQAIAINFTPTNAAPTNSRPAPTHPNGKVQQAQRDDGG